MKRPCFNCEKRVVGCHAVCKDYLEARAELDALHKKMDKEKRDEAAVNDCIFKSQQLGARRRRLR